MKNLTLAGGALLAAAAIPAHAVETDVYMNGNVAFSASHFSADSGDVSEIKNNASRIGLYASAEQNDMRAFVVYTRGFDRYNPANTNSDNQDYVRSFFGGLTTQHGTTLFGRTKSDYRLAGERIDPFYDTSVVGFSGTKASDGGTFREGANYGLSNLTNGFSDNALLFRSADYAGVRFNAGVYLNDNGENSAAGDKHDYSAGAAYAMSGLVNEADTLDFGVQYLDINNLTNIGAAPFNSDMGSVGGTPGESTNTRVHAQYAWGDLWDIGLSLENVDVEAEPDARLYSYLAGTFALTEATRLAAGVGFLDFDQGSPGISGTGYTFGAFHELMENVQTYAAVRFVDYDQPVNGDDDTTVFAVGASYSFELNLD